MTSLGKVRRLSTHDRRLLFRSLLLLPAIHASLLVFGYSRLKAMLEWLIPLKTDATPFSSAEVLPAAQGIARIVLIAAGHGIYKATCLRRSLLVWWLLREQGIPGQIRFGVRVIDHQLEAHAWVEIQGNIVNDRKNIRADYRLLEDDLPPKIRGL